MSKDFCHVHGEHKCSCNMGRRCRICNQPGHPSHLCPGNVRCAECNLLGYSAHNCNRPGQGKEIFIWKQKNRLPKSRTPSLVRFPRGNTHEKVWIEKQKTPHVGDVPSSVMIFMDTEFLLWIGQMMKLIYTPQILAAPVTPGTPLPANPFAVIRGQIQSFCAAIL